MRPVRFSALAIVATSVALSSVLSSNTLFAQPTSPPEPGSDEPETTWTPVETQDRVTATAWGREVALLRKVHLLTWDDTVAKPGFTSSLLVGKNGEKIPVQSVTVLEGRVDAVIPEDQTDRGVLLAAPDRISAISREGRISMSITDTEVLVQVLRGKALVAHAGLFKELLPGKVRVFSRASGKSNDVDPAPAPTLTAKRALGVALTGDATMSVQVPQEGTYCVALQDEGHATIGASQCVAGGSTVELAAPAAGNYFAVARQLGAGSLDGALSEPLPLQVLGAAPGQEPAQNGVFLLEPLERITFRGVEGLQMRYGTSDRFVPATETVGLVQNRATTVQFRHPGAPDQLTTVRLAPRISEVRTSIGPVNARWPGKPATVKVSVRDGSGRLLTEKDDLKLELSVNSTSIDVDFEVTDQGLVTTVPPQSGEGPWVVRLSVLDAKDRLLARDILEVASR